MIRRQVEALLAWYDHHGRRGLPWRTETGAAADPYRVWISEIMLQQTTVAAARPYFEAFVGRWPTVRALADAALDDVLHAWQGLGYYARARNLHACAQAVVARHGGVFPATVEALAALPGIGAYTAAAVAAIAFGVRTTPVDGNVVRVLARFYAIDRPLPAARPEIDRRAQALAPAHRPGDFAQALMDLGATLCTPRRPGCDRCPWRDGCAGRARGIAETLPRPAPKPLRPHRHGVALWVERPDGRVLFRRRPPRGLLGGMMAVPTSAWRPEPWPAAAALAAAAAEIPWAGGWRPVPGRIDHAFTHFALTLQVLCGAASDGGGAVDDAGGRWVAPAEFAALALPTLFRKVVAMAAGPQAAQES